MPRKAGLQRLFTLAWPRCHTVTVTLGYLEGRLPSSRQSGCEDILGRLANSCHPPGCSADFVLFRLWLFQGLGWFQLEVYVQSTSLSNLRWVDFRIWTESTSPMTSIRAEAHPNASTARMLHPVPSRGGCAYMKWQNRGSWNKRGYKANNVCTSTPVFQLSPVYLQALSGRGCTKPGLPALQDHVEDSCDVERDRVQRRQPSLPFSGTGSVPRGQGRRIRWGM
jgi:hypothetical protein